MDEDIKQAYQNLCDVNNILETLGILYTLDGGTLIGVARQKDFCQDDHNDIDLTVPYDPKFFNGRSQRDIAVEIMEMAGRLGFTLYHYWRKQPKTTAQLSIQRGASKIDIMFKEEKNGKTWWTIYGGGRRMTYKAVPARHFFGPIDSFQVVQLKEVRFLAPAFSDEYLKLRYGDWMTPVHASEYSCYQNDKSIVKNYEKI